jgi:hypothetical protein
MGIYGIKCFQYHLRNCKGVNLKSKKCVFPLTSVSEPYSFDPDPDPDPALIQILIKSGSGSNPDPG